MDIYYELSELKRVQQETLNIVRDLQKNGVVKNKEKVYDFTDLEEMLHVSRRTLFKWKSEGKMQFTQVGKKLYITDSELEKFLATNKCS